MKIGVLTYASTVDNYGQVLQYLATQDYLREKGHDPYLVLARPGRVSFRTRLRSKVLGIIKRVVYGSGSDRQEANRRKMAQFSAWEKNSKLSEEAHPRHFQTFREKYFHMLYGTYPEILQHNFDAFCVGSDQVWAGAGDHYLLSWTPKKCKRFTIAPSVGNRVYDGLDCRISRRSMRRFDFITVREDNALDFCRRCGRPDAVKVLDPVFLRAADQYTQYIKPPHCGRPYVFVYMLGAEISESVRGMVGYCERKGFEVKYVESQGRNEDVKKEYASVDEWLGLVSSASYVLTNSFHGMAFAAIFNKPFLVFPLAGMMQGMNVRIFDLAKRLGLESRVCRDGNLDHLFEDVDWSAKEQAVLRNRAVLDELMSTLCKTV